MESKRVFFVARLGMTKMITRVISLGHDWKKLEGNAVSEVEVMLGFVCVW